MSELGLAKSGANLRHDGVENNPNVGREGKNKGRSGLERAAEPGGSKFLFSPSGAARPKSGAPARFATFFAGHPAGKPIILFRIAGFYQTPEQPSLLAWRRLFPPRNPYAKAAP